MENLIYIHLVARPPQQLASRHVPENRGVRVGDGGQDALRLFPRALNLETAVDACHHEIKVRQHVVIVIERTVDKDIGFDALEDMELLTETPCSACLMARCCALISVTDSTTRVVR